LCESHWSYEIDQTDWVNVLGNKCVCVYVCVCRKVSEWEESVAPSAQRVEKVFQRSQCIYVINLFLWSCSEEFFDEARRGKLQCCQSGVSRLTYVQSYVIKIHGLATWQPKSCTVLSHTHLNDGLTENCTRPVFVIRLISATVLWVTSLQYERSSGRNKSI
jgi:hypothetical protein